MKEPKLKYVAETDAEIYYFNKWQSAKAELRHLRTECGKSESYIKELEDKVEKLGKGVVPQQTHMKACENFTNRIKRLEAQIEQLKLSGK